MTFDKSKWAVDGSNFNNTIPRTHKYATVDNLVAVTGANYFDSIYDQISEGDLIQSYIDTDGTPAVVLLQVTAITSGAVTVSAFDPDGTA